mmetsp:Transcript_5306/g.10597  ORF Transcript_5306/g.10597 Transcript_5306/m.10597 type:complete len:234 (+) Transcript_5306:53-754(+)
MSASHSLEPQESTQTARSSSFLQMSAAGEGNEQVLGADLEDPDRLSRSTVGGFDEFKARCRKQLFNRWFLFGILLLVIVTVANINEDENGEAIDGVEELTWPYFIAHFLFALTLFIFNALAYHVFVNFLDIEPIWVSALGCSVMWYVSREYRDQEKLGYFDHKGFWAPTLGISFVFCICEGASLYLEKKRNPHRVVSKYALTTVIVIFLTTLGFSIAVNDKFPGPWGSKDDDE